MVSRTPYRLTFFALIFLVVSLSWNFVLAAEPLTYRVDHEYIKVWINDDGTIDLFYNIRVICVSGVMNGFYIGQPTGDFKIGEAKDIGDANLKASDASSGSNYRVDVTLLKPINSGEFAEFTLLTNVGHMIYRDEDNKGNYGMKFVACWFEDAEVSDLRVQIIFPPGTKAGDVKNTPEWDQVPTEEEGRLVMYWERNNLARGQRFDVGVSFPSSLMPNYKVGDGSSGLLLLLIPFAFIGFIVLFIILMIVGAFKKRIYLTPQMNIEALGVKTGLTAVEAAQLLGLPPPKVVTAILYGLLLKKVVYVEGVEPSLNLKVSPRPSDPRYYEIDFLDAIKPDGYLSEEKLAKTIMYLRDTVDNKVRGYCREDTVNYYRTVVEQAWNQVEKAQTPELASNFFNEQLLWLMLDNKYVDRTKEKFTPIIFIPRPDWGWYNYNRRYLPSSEPSQGDLKTIPSAGKPSIPGADFADSVAKSLEQTSSKFVSNIEQFTKSILPPPAQQAQSHTPVQHKSNCVCACHACACACACVSCACACAGGGGH